MYQIKENINKNIFRGYDVRGIYPTELDEDTAYTFGLGFGSKIKEMGKTTCVIGHDNRLSSPDLTNALITGIKETGIDIIYLGLCTTPMYYYACIKLEVYSGVMVTASHNPKDDNGFKFAFDENGNCKGQEIQDFLDYILAGKFASGNGKVKTYDITNDYIELYRNNLHFGNRKLKVVLDPANGTTSIIARKIYEMFPMDLTIINEESDGHFPNHHPDPCIESNLEQLKEKVQELNADIGISFDGDGDRLGIVTNTSTFLPTDYYMIIIIRDIINKVEKKEFLYDVKCSKSLSDEIEKLGAKGICYRTGNSYTKAAIRQQDLPFGGELSGHVYYRDRWPGFDSGLYAGLRILEILSNTDKTVDELLDGINKYYATEEIKFASPDTIKFNVVDKIKEYAKEKGYNYLDIDGVKVLFDDGWALVRASNTGPNITARFEASSKERLAELQEEYTKLIEEYNK
ncbi:MAG: phosphomannomutase/phosphoglucomutase [Bacilli bacterium]|nr:phosphomannomutase/phosphoglucomutase [Bacilli bacterium]